MDEEIDKFFAEIGKMPPEHFPEKVMLQIATLPLPEPPSQPALRWIALLGVVLAGLIQFVAFLSGIWSATAAG